MTIKHGPRPARLTANTSACPHQTAGRAGTPARACAVPPGRTGPATRANSASNSSAQSSAATLSEVAATRFFSCLHKSLMITLRPTSRSLPRRPAARNPATVAGTDLRAEQPRQQVTTDCGDEMAESSIRLRPVVEDDLAMFRRFGTEPGLHRSGLGRFSRRAGAGAAVRYGRLPRNRRRPAHHRGRPGADRHRVRQL
jgi:hypothetical protein